MFGSFSTFPCGLSDISVSIHWMFDLFIDMLIYSSVFSPGGYFHGLNSLTYGVDLEKIRWLGILQVFFAC